jgi:hypothetical protein
MKKVIYETNNGSDNSKYQVDFREVDMNDTHIDLRYSPKDGQWTNPGKKIGSLFDNGNYVSLNIEGDKKIYLDYAQVDYVRMLLHAYDEANKQKHPSLYPTKLNKFVEVK